MPPLLRRLTAAAAVCAALTLGGALPGSVTSAPPAAAATTRTVPAAKRVLGTPRSGLPWHSGAWIGGRFDAQHLSRFESWRGRRADMVTTYAPRDSYRSMMTNTWSITTWKGFSGKLNYGLAPLPDNGEGSLTSIARGDQDKVWTKVAQNLRRNGRGNAVVRIGWESNLKDWRHQATAANATTYKRAWRRIQAKMSAAAPGLTFEFGIACGAGLAGSKDRLAPLTKVYPGDDVVDLVGCDTYDWWNTHATSKANWSRVLTPAQGPGIQDVATFARKHRKGASYAEWGLARRSGAGGGDNPFYIASMHSFFSKNRDVVAFECYFDEPDPYMANSLFGTRQNPRSAARYTRLW